MSENEFITNVNELGISINNDILSKLNKYYEILINWNNKINLTSIVEYEEVIWKHFLDSAFFVSCDKVDLKEKKKVEKIEKIKQEDISSKHAIENKEDVKETGLENITAFVGTNDFVAIGIMDAITSLGYRIPEDFSVCGFDNTLVASFSGISLTTIDHCIGEKGAYAVSMLMNQKNRMEQKDGKREKKRPIMRLEYEPQLIVRHSTGRR